MTRRKVLPRSRAQVRSCAFERADESLTRMDFGVMQWKPGVITLLSAVLVTSLAYAMPAHAQSTAAAPANAPFDVARLFATTCGWCHSDGGRAAGKGPQLMDSPRTDDFMHNRIKNGKSGAMPAFGTTFSDAQIDQIIKYIRELKPHEG